MEQNPHTIQHSAATHSHTVIFLHGRDSTATEFASEIFESQGSDDKTLLEALPSFKWVFPSSRVCESVRFGTSMSQWFDMWSVEKPQEQFEMQKQGLRESVTEVLDLINNEINVISPEQIILAGISQGCATAIHVLFNSGHRFGGFIGLSGWLPCVRQIEDICRAQSEAVERIRYIKAIPGRNREVSAASGIEACLETPVFLGHCKDVEVVPYVNGEALCKGLQDLGMQVEWHAYEDGGHWLNEPEGLDDLVEFLKPL